MASSPSKKVLIDSRPVLPQYQVGKFSGIFRQQLFKPINSNASPHNQALCINRIYILERYINGLETF